MKKIDIFSTQMVGDSNESMRFFYCAVQWNFWNWTPLRSKNLKLGSRSKHKHSVIHHIKICRNPSVLLFLLVFVPRIPKPSARGLHRRTWGEKASTPDIRRLHFKLNRHHTLQCYHLLSMFRQFSFSLLKMYLLYCYASGQELKCACVILILIKFCDGTRKKGKYCSFQ